MKSKQWMDTANAIGRASRRAYGADPVGRLYYAMDCGRVGNELVDLLLSRMTDRQRKRLFSMEKRWLQSPRGRDYVREKARNARRMTPEGIAINTPDGMRGVRVGGRPRRLIGSDPATGAAVADRALEEQGTRMAARPESELRAELDALERGRAIDRTKTIVDSGPAPRIGPDGRIVQEYAPSRDENDPVRFPVFEVASGHIGASRPGRMTDREGDR